LIQTAPLVVSHQALPAKKPGYGKSQQEHDIDRVMANEALKGC
jgi:hypothetical protein